MKRRVLEELSINTKEDLLRDFALDCSKDYYVFIRERRQYRLPDFREYAYYAPIATIIGIVLIYSSRAFLMK